MYDCARCFQMWLHSHCATGSVKLLMALQPTLDNRCVTFVVLVAADVAVRMHCVLNLPQ